MKSIFAEERKQGVIRPDTHGRMMYQLLFLGLLHALVALARDADLVLIQDELAKCLDGSPAAYYYRKGEGSGADKWLIYHEAGAWCGSLESCYHRSRMDLGSSKQYPAKAPPYFDFVSSNATRNPVLHNWNMIYFKNCDGGFWMGENMTTGTFRNSTLYFRGAYNRRALLRDLRENRGMVSPSEVLISGGSAGGMATFLHGDWYASQLPETTRVMAMAEGGFMVPYKGAGKCAYEDLMVGAYELFNASASVHSSCAELFKESGEVWRCLFFPQYTLPHMKTPIFVLNSRIDSWQTEHLLCGGGPFLLSKMSQKEMDLRASHINAFGHTFEEAFHPAVRANPKNGYVIDSCHHHLGGWNSIRLHDGRTQADAFADWYHALKRVDIKHGTATELLDMRVPLSGGNQTAAFPCVECCGTELQSDKRVRGLRRTR